MGKGKLAKFADMERYENVFQYPFSVADNVPFDMKGHWRDMYFKNSNPIVLELGCGRGEYTVGLAKMFPNINFIGVDIKDLKEIDAVGHRVVQGGDKFNESVVVDKSVEDGIEEICDLAPVHNAGHLKGIRAVDALMPGTPQVCVFDNAFHSTMPDYAYLYAIPYELYEKYHVRRYGFHGTSHRYVSKRVCEILGLDQNNSKIITCHIGNGGSIAAVLNGKVMDTSMGLTPLAGLMMGSRCGDIDASAVTYLMEKLNMKPQEMADFLNKKSGVLGITGISSDMRDIEKAANEGNEKALLALRMYEYRIKKYIGAYAAAMGSARAHPAAVRSAPGAGHR